MTTLEIKSCHLFNYGTPVEAKSKRESLAGWAFVVGVVVRDQRCVIRLKVNPTRTLSAVLLP